VVILDGIGQQGTSEGVLGGTGVVTTDVGTVATVGPAVPVLREVADFMREYALEAVIAVGACLIITGCVVGYLKWDERRRGIS